MIRIIYKVNIIPNTKGIMFKKNNFEKVLEPGVYEFNFIDPKDYLFAILDSEARSLSISHQELLSKDQIAFRLAFVADYIVTDFEKATKFLDFSSPSYGNTAQYRMTDLDEFISQETQIEMNSKLAQIESETIFSDYRNLNATEEELSRINSNLSGVKVLKIRIKEVSFPKIIQELFSKRLEAKIRAQTELENARTTVATARALNNVASMVDNSSGMKFLIYMDTLKNLATKGRHTFVVGDDGKRI